MKNTKVFLLIVVLLTIGVNLCAQTAEEWKKLGNAELDNTNYAKAIEYYQKAIEVDSCYFDAYYNMGSAYSALKDFDKSIEYYNKAITKNDTVASTYFALGNVYTDKQNYNKAIEVIKKGMTLQPDSTGGLYHYLSFLYGEKGSYVYQTLYAKKAAQMGDTLAQQLFIDNDMSWENTFVKPDYDQIKINIENKESDLYYSKLWDRYQQGDSTMTMDERRHLYYGYVFNEKYSPYSSVHDATQINAILNKDQPTADEWKELISLINGTLKLQPFNCRYLHYQRMAYHALEKHYFADRNFHKIMCILDALSSTGDGLERETAIHVTAVPNEYDYLYFNNLSMQSQSLMNGGYDVLYLEPNGSGLEELWFDVNQSLNFMSRSFE